MRLKNPLIQLCLRSCLVGFSLAAVFTVALGVFDIVSVEELAADMHYGYLATLLLWVLTGILFSAAQAAVTILRMPERRG